MLVRRVRIDLVDNQLQPEFVGARDHRVEIVERAEDRVDPAVIGDVIAEVALRRGEEGRHPHAIDPEARDMVEVGGDPGKVADAVAIAVGKAARINLVDRRALPPRRLQGGRRGRY